MQPLPAVAVDEFTTVTGTISPPTGFSLLSGSVSLEGGHWVRADASGSYSITVPKNQDVSLTFGTNIRSAVQGAEDLAASWNRGVVKFSAATVLDFQSPAPLPLNISVVDGQDRLVTTALLTGNAYQSPRDPYTDSSGQTWTGTQKFGSEDAYAFSETGVFKVWLYPTQSYPGLSYNDKARSSLGKSPSFDMLAAKTLKLCLPINMPSSGRLPEGCFVEEKSLASQTGTLQFQKAGSQVVIVSSGIEAGQFILFEDNKEVERFSLSDTVSSVVIEKRLTGSISIRRADAAVQSDLTIEATRGLLWFQNVNLGIIDPSRIEGFQAVNLNLLATGYEKLPVRNWRLRDSDVTKFICTGIYGPGSSLSDKIMARKRAKAACEYAQIQNPSSEVSFWFQTKETQAPSYVNKVLVTVKGLEKSVEEGLG